MRVCDDVALHETIEIAKAGAEAVTAIGPGMFAGDERILGGWGLTIKGFAHKPSRAVLMMPGFAGMLMRRQRSR